jgi:hypothetical protein
MNLLGDQFFGSICANHLPDLAGLLCGAEQESLHLLALKLAQHVAPLLRLDTFRGSGHLMCRSHRNDSPDNARRSFLASGARF